MARINIPLDALTSRFNLSGRFDSVRSQSIANRFANLKPIGEFLDPKRLSRPRDFAELQSRANYNLSYFSSNYAVVFAMLSIYSLLTNLMLLFVIVLVVGGMFGISKLQGADLDLGFARFTTSQLYTGLLIVAVPLGIWASPITTVLWLVGASAVTILGHAALMDKPIEASFSEFVTRPSHTHTITDVDAGRRFRDRSAAHSSPYQMGRPPAALSDGRRRTYDEDWELRDAVRHGERFEELESEDDDGQHGVRLNSNSYAWRDARQRGFAGDDMYFDGYDTARDRQRRRQVYDYGEEFDSDEDLVQSAMAKIAAARVKGKTNVSLSQDEMEALERRQSQPPEPKSALPVTALASPPPTPVRATRVKTGSRSSSSTSLTGQKGKRKVPASPAKSNSKTKVDRRPSSDLVNAYATSNGLPGVMVPGPNGVPVFAPLVSYPPPSPEATRSGGTRARSRSTSKHSRRESTPPERIDPYMQYPPRYYMAQTGVRPPSSNSNISMPDDGDWYAVPPSTRHRSASNAQYPTYRAPTTDDYEVPFVPAAQGRRNVSGPVDGRYAGLRRAPPSSSPLASRAAALPHTGAEASARKGTSSGHELERSGSNSSSSDDQGVQVNIVPDATGPGYSVNRAALSGNEGRRRKTGRR